MIHYLIDASVAADFYRPRESFPKSTYIKHRQLKEHITKQRLSGDAIIFIPAFCIPEVFNTFAKWWYRRNSVFGSQRSYEGAWNLFASHVHDRKFFYSYDLTRYHNLNCHEVSLVEHKTDTEYQATGLPTTATQEELNRKLQEKDRADFVSRHYLSTFDILVIAMGMELKIIHGAEVHLLTKDNRLALISGQKPSFPKPYCWPETSVSDLPPS